MNKSPRLRPRAAQNSGAQRRAPARLATSVDVVLLSYRDGRLSVLTLPSPDGARARRVLPWRWLGAGDSVGRVADALAREAGGRAPALLEQMRAYDARLRHVADAELSVAFLALVPGEPTTGEGAWLPVDALGALAPRHRAMVDDAVSALSARVDLAPVAFHLLPRTFTLSQLQEAYELLLGRHLHKASFRRALQGARLVEPLDEWRSEGRGRPAQLFRYAPAKRRGAARSARFDWM